MPCRVPLPGPHPVRATRGAAAKPSDPNAFDNYLRWYCSPYDMEQYKQLLQAVGWS